MASIQLNAVMTDLATWAFSSRQQSIGWRWKPSVTLGTSPCLSGLLLKVGVMGIIIFPLSGETGSLAGLGSLCEHVCAVLSTVGLGAG